METTKFTPIRKVFLCTHCSCIYADDPVSSCDFSVGKSPGWTEGVAFFGPSNPHALAHRILSALASSLLPADLQFHLENYYLPTKENGQSNTRGGESFADAIRSYLLTTNATKGGEE